MVVYFSGTGNSRYCAEAFSEALGDTMLNAFDGIRNKESAALHSERPWVFCAPTYAWRLPRVFSDYIRRTSFDGCRDAYFVMTCGDDIGDVEKRLTRLCKAKGLRYRGVLEVVMPENYVAMFKVPKPATAQKIIAKAEESLQKGIDCVRTGSDFPTYKANFEQRVKTNIVNPVFYAFCVKAKPFFVTDACIGCGKCEQVCVTGNIRIQDGKPVWGKDCTHCMACICRCPKEAVEYGNKSQGKPRYVCPPRKKD